MKNIPKKLKDLGEFYFMTDLNHIWIHRFQSGHDDLRIKLEELKPLAKRLKEIYKKLR